MDANAYSKRTDKVIAILEADARLYEDMGGAQITIRKGVPDEGSLHPAGIISSSTGRIPAQWSCMAGPVARSQTTRCSSRSGM